MNLPEGVELKQANQAKEPMTSGEVPDAIRTALIEGIGAVGKKAQRTKCLEMALKLSDVKYADQAISAAKQFMDFIQGDEA